MATYDAILTCEFLISAVGRKGEMLYWYRCIAGY